MSILKKVKAHFIHEGERLGHDSGSLTDVCCDPKTGHVYVGACALNNDILYVLDPKKGSFRSLNYQDIAEKCETKEHRSLIIDDDGMLYGATACLLGDFEDAQKAPGGSIFKYNPKEDKLQKLGIPCPHAYIQQTAMDRKRKIIYGLTYPFALAFKYEILSGKAEVFGTPCNYPHDLVVDDRGVMWTTWQQTNSDTKSYALPRWLSYDPEDGKPTYHTVGPFDEFCKYHPEPHGGLRIDSIINGDDGWMYIGTHAGDIYRFNPPSMVSEWLGRPTMGRRAAGLVIGKDGLLYGVAGQGYGEKRVLSELWCYDREKKSFNRLGPLFDKEKNVFCDYPHGLTMNNDGSRLYVAESDTPLRHSAVYECILEP